MAFQLSFHEGSFAAGAGAVLALVFRSAMIFTQWAFHDSTTDETVMPTMITQQPPSLLDPVGRIMRKQPIPQVNRSQLGIRQAVVSPTLMVLALVTHNNPPLLRRFLPINASHTTLVVPVHSHVLRVLCACRFS
jgi:hypothetical protein